MPQTLLAIAAITAAGFLTLSQTRSVHSTTESVMQDQFELAVAGTLLHTIEFADARAFDEATTPGALRARYGIPDSMTVQERDAISAATFADLPASVFSDPSTFGNVTCNVQEPWETPSCDDTDDIHGGDWQEIEFTTPDGHPLPVEVRASVTYVEVDDPDVPVPYQTFHKRVEVAARTTAFAGQTTPHVVSLRRVISFDPAVAAEYVRRSVAIRGSGPACPAEADWLSNRQQLEDDLATAIAAQSMAAAAVGTLSDQLSTSQANHDAALVAAQDAASARDDAYDEAVNAYYVGTFVHDGQRYWLSAAARDAFNLATDRYHDARSAATAAETAAVDAGVDVVTAQAALDAAQAVVSAESQRVADAQAALDDHVATPPPSCV